MGLLDDAIREHLELKRLRGADPGVVAREERDAFGPGHGGAHIEVDGYGDVEDPEDPAGDMPYQDISLAHEDASPVDPGHVRASAPEDAHHVQAPPPEDGREFSHGGQETAEIDMRLVLEAEDGTEEQVAQEPGSPEVDPDQERLWLDEDSPRDLDFDR